jgi:predicted Zn-dependent peptidase
LLSSVTLEDVNAAARKTLDVDRASVVVAGPYQG